MTNSIQYAIKNQHREYNFKNNNSIVIHETGSCEKDVVDPTVDCADFYSVPKIYFEYIEL